MVLDFQVISIEFRVLTDFTEFWNAERCVLFFIAIAPRMYEIYLRNIEEKTVVEWTFRSRICKQMKH